jgi:hypothetical protein
LLQPQAGEEALRRMIAAHGGDAMEVQGTFEVGALPPAEIEARRKAIEAAATIEEAEALETQFRDGRMLTIQ